VSICPQQHSPVSVKRLPLDVPQRDEGKDTADGDDGKQAASAHGNGVLGEAKRSQGVFAKTIACPCE
jgi:hypothetical protein